MNFQRYLGNQGMQNFLKSSGIQPKLTVGQPNDIYEQEADCVAERIMSMPEPVVKHQENEEEEEQIRTKKEAGEGISLVQRQTEKKSIIQRQEDEPEEEGQIQAKVGKSDSTKVNPAIESSINSLRDRGQPLTESLKNYFEPRFGYDFNRVKIHSGNLASETAKSINACAFTVGNDIVLNSDDYSLDTGNGKKLLAHELVHIIQQNKDSEKKSDRNKESFILPKMEEGRDENNESKEGIKDYIQNSIILQNIPLDNLAIQKKDIDKEGDEYSKRTHKKLSSDNVSLQKDKRNNLFKNSFHLAPSPFIQTFKEEAAHWYTPWIRDATFSKGQNIGYVNYVKGSKKPFDTGWARDATTTALLNATTSIATAILLRRLSIGALANFKDWITLLGGASVAAANGYMGYHAEEKVWGYTLQTHNWYGRYRYNAITGNIKAVDFWGTGNEITTLGSPLYYKQRVADAAGNSIYEHWDIDVGMGPDISKMQSLPESSYGVFD
jgi:Zn-dependent peptidase ImmA (M78 family)